MKSIAFGFSAFMINVIFFCFFFNDTATTEIYTLSLHDALPIPSSIHSPGVTWHSVLSRMRGSTDRKSTRLNSSHMSISYAVFCLKKKQRNRGAQRAPREHHPSLPNETRSPST